MSMSLIQAPKMGGKVSRIHVIIWTRGEGWFFFSFFVTFSFLLTFGFWENPLSCLVASGEERRSEDFRWRGTWRHGRPLWGHVDQDRPSSLDPSLSPGIIHTPLILVLHSSTSLQGSELLVQVGLQGHTPHTNGLDLTSPSPVQPRFTGWLALALAWGHWRPELLACGVH